MPPRSVKATTASPILSSILVVQPHWLELECRPCWSSDEPLSNSVPVVDNPTSGRIANSGGGRIALPFEARNLVAGGSILRRVGTTFARWSFDAPPPKEARID